MNRASLRQWIIDQTGYPEQGPSGQARLNRALDAAMLRVTKDLPDRLARFSLFTRTQATVTLSGWRAHATDPYTLNLFTTDTSLLPIDGTWDARPVDILRSDGTHQIVMAREVAFVVDLVDPANTRYILVLDRPWPRPAETDIQCSFFCNQVALPGDCHKVHRVQLTPWGTGRALNAIRNRQEITTLLFRQGITTPRRPEWCAQGDFFQLRSPHETPAVAVVADPDNTQKWGRDYLGTEHGSAYAGDHYEAAGTFSYCYCLVWGRAPQPYRLHAGTTGGTSGLTTRGSNQAPWYISAPSTPSAQVTTTWGGGMVKITTSNQHFIEGYGVNTGADSYNRSGLEKWIFRARHATQSPTAAGNNAQYKRLEDDGVYYLWRIVDAGEEVTADRGDSGPVDRQFPLTNFHGHQHLMLDTRPNLAEDLLIELDRRPVGFTYDTDVSPVDPDCNDLLVAAIQEQLQGDRDGSLERKNFYRQVYAEKLAALRRRNTMMGEVSRMGLAHGPPDGGRLGYPIVFQYGT